MNPYAHVNRHSWDLRTSVHVRSQFYDVDAFRSGSLSLKPPEMALAGNVRQLRLLHLQCHFGLDTLSWARLGAAVTGVDLSPVALDEARRLSAETDLPATFVEHDVQALGDLFQHAFDIVITTYGVICWLHDLSAWARAIRGSIRPRGRFILVEFHPILEVLHPGSVSGCQTYYGRKGSALTRTSGTYTDASAPIEYSEYRWQHPISAVVGALLGEGFRIMCFNEYSACAYPVCPGLVQREDGMWIDPKQPFRLPYMYAVVAEAA